MERLNKECVLPLEWMETTINGQTLQVSYCQIKRQNNTPYFRRCLDGVGRLMRIERANLGLTEILVRDIHDSIISTVIISSDLEKKSVRGICYTEVPSERQTSKIDKTNMAIKELRARMQCTSLLNSHPLLLPLQFLEGKLQELEQTCATGLPAATLMSLSHEVERIRNLRSKNIEEKVIDVPMTIEGIYEAHLHFRRGQRRLSDVKAVMRAMIEGSELLAAEKVWQAANEEVFYCVKRRLGFLQERIRALERQLEITVNEFQSLDTMVGYNPLPIFPLAFLTLKTSSRSIMRSVSRIVD